MATSRSNPVLAHPRGWQVHRRMVRALLAGLASAALAVEAVGAAPPSAAASAAPTAAADTPSTAPAAGGSPDTAKDPGSPKADAPAAAAKGLAALDFRSRTPLDFGKVALGSAGPAMTVTLVAGPGASAVESYTVRSSSADFKVTPASCDLAAKGSCALSVSFAPTKPGATGGAIVVADVHGGPTRVAAELTGSGQSLCEAQGLMACSGWAALGPAFAVCALYLLAMLYVRWNMVATPAREQLRAEIDTVRSRAVATPAAPPTGRPAVTAVLDLVDQAAQRMDLGSGWKWLVNVVFWSRGQEHMGFQLLHEAKHVLVAESPPAILRVELEVAEGRLRALNEPGALALAHNIRAELDKALLDVNNEASAVLHETLAFLKRTAGDTLGSVATALAPHPAAAVAEMAALARKLQIALAPEQQLALEAAVKAALQAPAADLPPQLRVLLSHTQEVLLKRAQAARAALDLAASAAAPTAAGWQTVMADFSQQYLAVAEALRVRIEATLAAAVVAPPERWRALAREANHHLYDVEDAEFAWTASWHKKTLWLTFLGLALIFALSATFSHTTFFLLGALGGLLSRMQRMLTRDKVPVDYGQSWVTLFLSPVVGALAGWGGVLLVAVAVDWGLLGTLFSKVVWDQPHQTLTMGVALLFGISERLLMSVVESLEGKAGAGDSQTPPAPPAAAARGAEGKAKPVERSGATAAAATRLEITTASTLPKCKAGSEFSQKFRAEGGAPPLRWTVARGPLPKGLSLDDKGELKGKPQERDNPPFTLAVSDSAGGHHEREFTLQVTA